MRVSSSLLAAVALFSAPSLQLSETKTIYQFPNTTWLENIHATRNGSLLTGIVGVPELYLVNPFKTPATASLVYSFPSANAVFGITDLGSSEYAVATANYSFTTGAQTDASVWRVNLRDKKLTKKIATIPNAVFFNGLVNLNERTLLVADSGAGHVLKLDAVTGNYSVIIDHPSMKATPGAALPIGINGVKIHHHYLYYTNTFSNSTINRVRINREGKAVGRFETVSANGPAADDFAVTDDGDVIVGRPSNNIVDRVRPNGRIETLAGSLNSSVVAGTTAVTLGRTRRDANIAYVSTTGGQSTPPSSGIEGGKIVAIKLC